MAISKVSVAIPTYNRAHYICETIDSVLVQTYKDYEIIVVDDGSTDNTREILKRYGGKIKYFYQANQGQASAWNYAVSQSSGEYIAFLDDDDLWFPEKLERQVEVLDKNPDLGFVCSESYVFSIPLVLYILSILPDGLFVIQHVRSAAAETDRAQAL